MKNKSHEELFNLATDITMCLITDINFIFFKVRHAREEAAKEKSGGAARGLEGTTNDTSLVTHLKGIHDAVKLIQLELQGMRKDMTSTSYKGGASSVDGGSESKTHNSQTRKRPSNIPGYFNAFWGALS